MFDLPALVNEFLEYLEIERNLSPLTIRDYRHYLENFDSWSKAQSPIAKPQDITVELIRKYRVYLAHYNSPNGNLPIKKVTQNYYVIALRSFLRYLIRKDLPVVAPEKIDLPKVESRSLKFLDRDQLERLLAQPDISGKQGIRDKTIMEMLFSTGLRVSELCKLNRDQINLERREFGVIGKGGRAREVFSQKNRSVKSFIHPLCWQQGAHPKFREIEVDSPLGAEAYRKICAQSTFAD